MAAAPAATVNAHSNSDGSHGVVDGDAVSNGHVQTEEASNENQGLTRSNKKNYSARAEYVSELASTLLNILTIIFNDLTFASIDDTD